PPPYPGGDREPPRQPSQPFLLWPAPQNHELRGGRVGERGDHEIGPLPGVEAADGQGIVPEWTLSVPARQRRRMVERFARDAVVLRQPRRHRLRICEYLPRFRETQPVDLCDRFAGAPVLLRRGEVAVRGS